MVSWDFFIPLSDLIGVNAVFWSLSVYFFSVLIIDGLADELRGIFLIKPVVALEIVLCAGTSVEHLLFHEFLRVEAFGIPLPSDELHFSTQLAFLVQKVQRNPILVV